MPQRILKTVNKARYTGTLLLFFVGTPSHAGDVLVTVEGIHAKGPLYGALVAADEKAWPTAPLKTATGQNNTLRFADIPAGEYAVQVFQDLNGNAELDQTRRGLPLEPVGFSSNPALFNGKPSPDKASFEHGSANTQVNVRLRQSKKRS